MRQPLELFDNYSAQDIDLPFTKGASIKYVRSEGGGGGKPKAYTLYKIYHFLYTKSVQGPYFMDGP